jgi:hypothetical protein
LSDPGRAGRLFRETGWLERIKALAGLFKNQFGFSPHTYLTGMEAETHRRLGTFFTAPNCCPGTKCTYLYQRTFLDRKGFE